ncbi:MAG: imidazole glycerol phosphate synthase subunit HisH [Alphaproteobacteria bacterium]|nr:MAG: imidazole glycerol phosphate synthase subunit HisH [Alphaproteobacteria bacterium]
MITIVDYGMGNLGSIRNMLKRIGVPAEVTGDVATLERATKILLPGVGAFDSAMQRINASGLRAVLDRKALLECVPIMGICLGMQLLTRASEEGRLPGLGWIPAVTRRFPDTPGLKVPHMGWNVVTATRDSLLTSGLAPGSRYYFVHSYYVQTDDPRDSVLTTRYGVTFDAVVAHRNLYGAQFHPEKSHKYGMSFLSNFARV